MALASSAMVNVPCHRVTPLASASQDVSCSGGIFSLSLSPSRCFGRNLKLGSGRRGVVVCFTRPLRPVEERFKIQVERNVDQKRKEELNVERWSKWDSDCCAFDHEWKVDEQVYVVKGSVRVTPEDCEDHAYFYAGDLVRFPKWFSATLSFDEEYEQRYRFLAYGDD